MSTKVMRRSHVNLNLSRFTSVNCQFTSVNHQFTVNWQFTMVYNNLQATFRWGLGLGPSKVFLYKRLKIEKKVLRPQYPAKLWEEHM